MVRPGRRAIGRFPIVHLGVTSGFRTIREPFICRSYGTVDGFELR